MKGLSNFKKHVGTYKELCELLAFFKGFSTDTKKDRHQFFQPSDKTIASKKTSMRKSRTEESVKKMAFFCFSSAMLLNSLFIIIRCSSFKWSIWRNNRCCFAYASFNSAFNFFRCFFKRRQRAMFREIKSHKRFLRTHSVHLFESKSILHKFENDKQL